MLANKLKFYLVGKNTHPPLVFNNNIVSQMNSHEHLGVMLDLKLTLEEHLLNVFKKGKVHYQ